MPIATSFGMLSELSKKEGDELARSSRAKSNLPVHTLDVPAVDKAQKSAQDTQPSSPWKTDPGVLSQAQEYLLPDESEFPTTLAPSRELLAFADPSPNTIQDVPALPPRPPHLSGQPLWPDAFQMTTQPEPIRDALLPSVREVLLPLEDDESTMAAHVLHSSDSALSTKNLGDSTEQALVGLGRMEDNSAQHETFGMTGNVLAFLPPDTKEYPMSPTVSAPSTKHGADMPSGSIHITVFPPATGEDTFDHLLQDLGLEQPTSPPVRDSSAPWPQQNMAHPTQEKLIHTLEQPKPMGISAGSTTSEGREQPSSLDSSPSLASVPMRSSFAPGPRSDAEPDSRAKALRLRPNTESSEGSQSGLSAPPTPRPRSDAKRSSARLQAVRGQSNSRWQLWTHFVFWGIVLVLVLGATFFAFLYHTRIHTPAKKVKLVPLHFGDVFKE